jgi:hypothetical protein
MRAWATLPITNSSPAVMAAVSTVLMVVFSFRLEMGDCILCL